MSNQNAVDVLPDELLMDILELALNGSKSYRDVLNLAGVNRRFRSCPSVWANIRLTHTRKSLRRARVAFSRSQSSVLTLHIDLDKQARYKLPARIQNFLRSTSKSVIGTMSVRIGRETHNQATAQAGLQLLNCSRLRDLLILWKAPEDELVTDPFILPHLPNLEHFSFGGFCPQPSHGMSFPSVKRLSFIDWEHRTLPAPFLDLLDLFPNVVQIDFKGLWFDDERTFPRSITLERLERVTLAWTVDCFIWLLFQNLHVPRLHTVTLVTTLCDWELQDDHSIPTTMPHPSVQHLELHRRPRSDCGLGDTVPYLSQLGESYISCCNMGGIAPYLPHLFPNLHTISTDLSVCVCWREVAKGDGSTWLWPLLQTINITGVPDKKERNQQPKSDSEKEEEYKQVVQWLIDFASSRNRTPAETAPAPLSITFEVAFPWETIAAPEIVALSREVDQLQVGGTVIKGAVSIAGADEA